MVNEYLVKAALPNIDNARSSVPCEEGTCQLCDNIITTKTSATKACGKACKSQSLPLNCNSEKVLLLFAKPVGMIRLLEKLKQNSVFGLIVMKVKAQFTVNN